MSLSIVASRNSRFSSGSDEVRLTPHERVTAQISSLLERGVRPWIKPWDDIAPPDALVLPLRSCGTPYRDGVDAPQTAKPARMRKAQSQLREVQMTEVVVVGLDIAKHVFQAHGADGSGAKLFNRKLSRGQVLKFLASLSPCIVAMEACSTSQYWAREIEKLGHTPRLIPPQYVKPYVKRQKNDATDAEAIAEAAMRPTMRFVTHKSAEKHADGMLFRGRDLLVRQRSQLINALRGHFAEYGFIAPPGLASVKRLRAYLEQPDLDIPDMAQTVLNLLLGQIDILTAKMVELDEAIAKRAKADELTRRLMTIPGIGRITAMAISALAPPASVFEKGRDFAAWIGLTPQQHSSGGKERLGRITKKGNTTLRRLLVICASSRVKAVVRFGVDGGAWLTGLLSRKPRMVAITALANKLARMVWAMSISGASYKTPEASVA